MKQSDLGKIKNKVRAFTHDPLRPAIDVLESGFRWWYCFHCHFSTLSLQLPVSGLYITSILIHIGYLHVSNDHCCFVIVRVCRNQGWKSSFTRFSFESCQNRSKMNKLSNEMWLSFWQCVFSFVRWFMVRIPFKTFKYMFLI